MPLLQVDNISYSYKQKEILHKVSFNLKDGERLGLAGASGSGKTTLLKLLAGQLGVQKGKITFAGQDFSHHKKHLVAGHEHIKLLNQDFNLSPVLTVDENIEYKGRKLSKTKLKKHLGRSHNKLSLGLSKNQQAQFLSGGQMQRTALAATLAAQPNLLLLDEPFNQLDYALKQRVLDYLNEDYPKLSRIMVSHEPGDLLAHSHRILILEKGKLIQDATPFQVFHFPVSAYAARVTGAINLLNAGQQKILEAQTPLLRPVHIICRKGGVPARVIDKIFKGSTCLFKIKLEQGKPDETLLMQAACAKYKIDETLSIGIKKPSEREGF
jgi:iron(III) transport system ATP-binding protein